MEKEEVALAYGLFKQKCQAIIDSQYIMSNTQIMKLLRFLASTPCLMEFIAKCNKGLDYNQEFTEATSGATFRLPQSKRKIVALVTGMLYMIDRNQLNFGSFLIKFYGSDQENENYNRFCNSVLVPYVEAFELVLTDEVEQEVEVKQDQGIVIDESVKEQIYPYISAVKELVENDPGLKDKKRNEFLIMLEGFNYVIELFNCKMIEVVWIGLKSVMSSYKPVQSFLKSLESILSAFAIIKS